jgi:hypothetical protein
VTRRKDGAPGNSTAIHPDQVLAKCANGQMETRLAVLVSVANDGRSQNPGARREATHFWWGEAPEWPENFDEAAGVFNPCT